MNRYAKDRRKSGGPHPVNSVELSGKNTKTRFYLTLLFAGVGIALIIRAVLTAFSSSDGWNEITADSTSEETDCSEEFYFLYDLGSGDTDATTENKQLTALYTQLCASAYEMFNVDSEGAGSANIYDINHSINEEVTVDAWLYEAFSLMEEYSDRSLYLGPLYEYYDNVFYCSEDYETEDFDPSANADTAAYYQEIIAYALDEDSVSIELLGDNTVRLNVSEEYQAFADASGFENFIDFYWLKNAFITDYLADGLIEEGYTHGCITSYDGFVKNLGDSEETFSYTIYKRVDSDIYQPASIEYTGAMSIVYLRDYMLSDIDTAHYYEMDDGTTLSCYVDIEDGTCKSSISDLVSYSSEKSCAEILLDIVSVYVTDEWDQTAALGLSDNSIYVIYSDSETVYYNDTELYITAEDDWSLQLAN